MWVLKNQDGYINITPRIKLDQFKKAKVWTTYRAAKDAQTLINNLKPKDRPFDLVEIEEIG
jgi:hypothetical protein